MASIRLIAAATVLSALVLAAPAGAAQHHRGASRAASPAKPAATPPVAAAAAVARRYWGATPCQGSVRVTPRRAVAAGLDAGASAWVTFGSALGANNLAAPADTYTDCTIAFARKRWPTARSMRQDWDIFCATTVHEWGHLLGRTHELTPGSVMVPVFTDLSSVPPLCAASAPAGG